MKLVEMLRNIFTSAETVKVNQQLESARYQLAVEDFAIQMAINLIAGTIAKCEFRTMLKGKQVKGDDYYTFNVEPNKNQNSSQFWHSRKRLLQCTNGAGCTDTTVQKRCRNKRISRSCKRSSSS